MIRAPPRSTLLPYPTLFRSRHSKVEPGSLELKPKLGVVSFDGLLGPESIVVLGGVRSIVQVWLAGVGSVLPAGARASTPHDSSPSSTRIPSSGLEQTDQLRP